MKKSVLFIFIFFVLSIQAQDYSFISKDLHLMNDKELRDNEVQISENTSMFDVDGKSIEPYQINSLMSSGNFIPMVFGDEMHNAQAVVFRELNETEIKKKNQKINNKDPNTNFIQGIKATNFSVKDIEGNLISLTDFKEKIIILNFWFTGCQPCRQEIPRLNKLVEKYKKDVVFIAVTFDDKSNVRDFLSKNNFDYIHITNNESILEDYSVSNFSSHIIIDQNGEIVLRKVGDFINEIDKKIELLLKH